MQLAIFWSSQENGPGGVCGAVGSMSKGLWRGIDEAWLELVLG
jgi:hypothetical protein